MARVLCLCWFLWSALVLTLSVYDEAFAHSSDEDFDILQQKAEYQLKELVSTINQLKSSHRLHKRDLRAGLSPTIIDSLKGICEQLSIESLQTLYLTTPTLSPENILKEQFKDNMEKNISYEGEDLPSKWQRPKLDLVSVDASREGNTSYFTFSIIHSSQAFAMRTMSLDYFRTTIGASGKYSEPVTSEIRLSADSSWCRKKPSSYSIITYTFGLVEDKDYTVKVPVDVCRFDRTKIDVDKGNGTFGTKKLEDERRFQQFAPTQFRIHLAGAYDGNEILITPGEDSEFYIDMAYDLFEEAYTPFDTHALFWDWDDGAFVETGSNVVDPNQPVSIEEEDSLLKVQVLHRTVLNDTNGRGRYTAESNTSYIIQRVKLTISSGSRAISGRLTLSFSWFGDRRTPQRVVRHTGTERNVYLRLPYKMRALPSEVMVHAGGEHRCRNDGHPDSTEDCVIECFATGSDIKSIFMVKNNPYVPPVRSVSYVLNGMSAHTQVDMGAPSPEINGTYRCGVVTEDGKLTSDEGTIVSIGFTKIHSTTVDELGNGSVQITCVASGIEPFSLYLSLKDINGYDDDLNHEKEISSFYNIDNNRTLKVLLDTERLLFPIATVQCTANGARWMDWKKVNVSRYIGKYNETAPIINPDLFTMRHFENGTTRISCTASGDKDVNVDIVTPDYQYGNHDFSVTETDTENGKTVVVYFPTRLLSRLHHETDVSCMARNIRGRLTVYIDEGNIEQF